MVLDGDTIAAYLVAAAAGAGRRAPDGSVEPLLDQLLQTVTRSVGSGPVDRLVQDGHDQGTMHEIGLLIDGAMSRDRSFAQEMTNIVSELDRRGGPELVDAVSAGYAMPGATGGPGVGGVRGEALAASRRDEPTHLVHWSPLGYMPLWAKIFMSAGFATFVAGMVIFGYSVFTTASNVDGEAIGQGFAPGVGLGFGVCAVGIVLAGIGIVGGQMKRRR